MTLLRQDELPPIPKPLCENCFFFRNRHGDEGQCHVDAPVIIQTQPPKGRRHYGKWPWVPVSESCGKYMQIW